MNLFKMLPQTRKFYRLNCKRVEKLLNYEIVNGPFAGLKYVNCALGSSYIAKVLGTYELELSPVLNRIFQKEYDCIVNIGAAEGYYAVGLASRIKNVPVIAFESNPLASELINSLASLNNLPDRIEIQGFCDNQSLNQVIANKNKPLLVVDVEGAEDEILDFHVVPALKDAEILVEMHDVFIPGLTPKIISRFENTHKIEKIISHKRTVDDVPGVVREKIKFVRNWHWLKMMKERPEEMVWLYMVPNQA